MTFDEICEFIIDRIEGGYANDPRDNGGETKWGISVKAHPELKGRIKDLTFEDAKKIYKSDYYTPSQLSKYPMKLRLAVMDGAINHGILGNSKLIQRSLNRLGSRLAIDGVVGPKTLAAVKGSDSIEFLAAYARTRLEFYRALSDYSWAGQGWENRILLILAGS